MNPGFKYTTLKNITVNGHPTLTQGTVVTLRWYRTGPASADTQTSTVASDGSVTFNNNAWSLGTNISIDLSVAGNLSTPIFSQAVVDTDLG